MLPGVPARIGVSVELPQEFHLQAGFLPGLPAGRVLQGLAVFHEASGQGPAPGRPAPFNQDQALVPVFNDDVHGGHRIAVSPGAVAALGTDFFHHRHLNIFYP